MIIYILPHSEHSIPLLDFGGMYIFRNLFTFVFVSLLIAVLGLFPFGFIAPKTSNHLAFKSIDFESTR